MLEPPRRIGNIGPRARRERAVLGVLGLLVGAAGVWVLHAVGGSRLWLLAMFAAFWVGSVGLLQAYEHTCVVLAARGARDMDEGTEAVRDRDERRRLRQQAYGVIVESTIVAALLTAAAAFLLA
jgi:hypothetical protein